MNPVNGSCCRVVCGLAGLGLATLFLMATMASATTYTWSGGGSPDPAMTNAANWVGGVAPPFFDYNTLMPDDIVFTGSVNTSPVVPDSWFSQPPRIGGITFDGAASAFTIGPADADHYLHLGIDGMAADTPIVNNSTATQTLGAVAMHAGTVNAASGALVFNQAFNVGGGDSGSGYDVTIKGAYDVTFDGGLTGGGQLILGDGSTTSPAFTGRVFINADSTDWAGNTLVKNGIVRISSDNALGKYGTTNNDYYTQISGENTGAGIELEGGITCPENWSYTAKGKSATEAIWRNVSGENTLTGRFEAHSGGANYPIYSDAGKLTFDPSNGVLQGWDTGTRKLYLRGAGDGEFKCEVKNWSDINKYDSGTWTLSNALTQAGSTQVISISGGTLALVGAATINDTKWIYTAGAGTFDVSGINGGLFTLSAGTKAQTLYGYGTVKGDVTAATGTVIWPGAHPNSSSTQKPGRLTFDGDLTMQAGSSVLWRMKTLTDDATGIAGTDFSQIVIKNGDLDLGASAKLTLKFDLLATGEKPADDPLNAFWNAIHTWKIIDIDELNGGTNSGSTDFASIVISGTQPTAMAFDTYVGTGIDLGDIFLKCTPTNLPPIPGDATRNGVVDADDATLLAQHWGETGDQIGWDQGDFNADHTVNAADASILAANWGSHTESSAVPEPSLAALLLGMLVGASAIRTIRRDIASVERACRNP